MKIHNCFLGLALLIISQTSCNQRGTNVSHSTLLEINASNCHATDRYLYTDSNIIESYDLETINFNESNEVFAKPQKLIVKNDCLYLKTGPAVLVYDFDGNLVLKLFHRGNGAGEYLGIADFQIEDNGDLLINDLDGRKMIRYNSNGEHLNTINHGLLSNNFTKIDDKVYLNTGVLLNNKSTYFVNIWNDKML